jgi:hypothetical protein
MFRGCGRNRDSIYNAFIVKARPREWNGAFHTQQDYPREETLNQIKNGAIPQRHRTA